MFYISHNINLDYIKQFLCISKDEPENLCGGSCQLKSKLELAEKQNTDKKTENSFPQFNFFSLHTKDRSSQNHIISSKQIKYFIYHNFKIVKPYLTIETPPPEI